MAETPELKGLRPVPEKEPEEAPALKFKRPEGGAKVSQFIRPEHRPMNCYPTAASKKEFEGRVEDLATLFRKAHGRKIPNGAIHEVAIALLLDNWELVVERVME